MSGFVVVADDAPEYLGVPTIRLSVFASTTQWLRETYQDFLNPPLRLPFGFVNAPVIRRSPGVTEASALVRKDSDLIFIVPVEVIERHYIEAWRFESFAYNFMPNKYGYGPWVYYVVKASPLRFVGKD